LVETAKRQPRPPKSKKDYVTESLIELCTKYKDSNELTVVRDLSMITLCFSGFLRYDEISSIRCKDIIFKDDHLQIKISKSKTDQYRMGNEIVISKGQSFACPYNLLKKYFLLADTNSMSEHFLLKPIFRSKHRCSLIYKNKPLSYTRARVCIISRLKEVIFSSNIGLFSLRAGGATVAANSNVNERCWKRHGRWKSDSAKDGYIADSLEHRLDVTKLLGL
jgi:integrase